MKIETKFDVGEEVYFLMDNEIVLDEIRSFKITKEVNRGAITVYFIGNYVQDFKESKLFKTKEELLNSL